MCFYLSASLLHDATSHDRAQHLYGAHDDGLLVRAQLKLDGLRSVLEDGPGVHEDHEVAARLLGEHHVQGDAKRFECCFVLYWNGNNDGD